MTKLLVSPEFARWARKTKCFDGFIIEHDFKAVFKNSRTSTEFEQWIFKKLNGFLRVSDLGIDNVNVRHVRSYGEQLTREQAEYLLGLWKLNYNPKSDYSLITLT